MAHIPSTILQRRENKVWRSNGLKAVGRIKENEDLEIFVRVWTSPDQGNKKKTMESFGVNRWWKKRYPQWNNLPANSSVTRWENLRKYYLRDQRECQGWTSLRRDKVHVWRSVSPLGKVPLFPVWTACRWLKKCWLPGHAIALWGTNLKPDSVPVQMKMFSKEYIELKSMLRNYSGRLTVSCSWTASGLQD